ncbi:hypothetical protein SLA2020_129140 [Shorea laevis]
MSFLKKTMAMPLLLLLGFLLAASNASAQTVLSCPANNLYACVGTTGNVAPSTLCCSGIAELVRIKAQLGDQAAKNCEKEVIATGGPINFTVLENVCPNNK